MSNIEELIRLSMLLHDNGIIPICPMPPKFKGIEIEYKISEYKSALKRNGVKYE